MTRKEEIYKAARAYVSGILLSSPSDVIHFENGAKWADDNPPQDIVNFNDVWHNVTEEPQDKSHILIRYNYMRSVEFKSYHIDYQCDFKWLELVEIFGVECWTYISDLLQKGGEK